jgi:hypothetical protein
MHTLSLPDAQEPLESPPWPIHTSSPNLVRIHDPYNIEIKVYYNLCEKVPSSHCFELYFFLPNCLVIQPQIYLKEQFYADLRHYTRFSLPHKSYADLMAQHDFTSPAHVLRDYLAEIPSWDRKKMASVERQLKLLANFTRSALSTEVQRQEKYPPPQSTLATQDAAMIYWIQDTWDVFVQTAQRIAQEQQPHHYRLACNKVMVYMREVVESYFTALMDIRQRMKYTAYSAKRIGTALLDFLAKSAEHLLPDNLLEDDFESDLYYRGLIKKEVMSVLFLTVTRHPDARFQHIFAAIAAAFAMLYATLAAVVIQKWVKQDMPIFLGLWVVTYVVKDRIKDFVKSTCAAWFRHAAWDYRFVVTKPFEPGKPLARGRELFAYLKHRELPKNLAQLCRQYVHRWPDSPSVTMRYMKETFFRPNMPDKNAIRDVYDIFRLNMQHFTSRVDRPTRTIRRFNPIAGHVQNQEYSKTYRMHLALRTWSRYPHAQEQIQIWQLVFDQQGVRSIHAIH